MKLIKQENQMGCGIACAAVILNFSYKRTFKLFSLGKADFTGFTCKEIVDALKRGGLDYSYKYIKPRLKNIIYKEDTIVFIQRSNKYKHGHYLVRGRNIWMDPWINFPNANRRSGFRKRLPGKSIYVIFSN
ncbi:MAG: hypothetical protein UU22_C0042G0005 [Parcubacteria group bacterium GW2011_GWA2_40_8]|uniref:Peptidase C39 domain-containing protein n=1 Tax=Candidatus Terrybacteria bacterium RIFCSPLOWO2_01_FULL_40_23 TaxID=1802366 RepID=A0A1G2PQ08_9BACT|nr:MAG: hypothetical protein UU22_C0042G0005 [Parcubacteria group bacterium GW2011_GWA2_40_8]OHA50373.1 MAG: hypothetical protein A3A97_03415 [Candidatus Terrybacteria bacterium RIFCSPLOWO2_01_FULL_40_23]